MNEVTTSALFLGAEFGALLTIFFIAVGVYFLRRRAADKRYVANFIEDYKGSVQERHDAMRQALEFESLLIGEDLDSFMSDMSIAEKRLYKRILNMYLGHERKCLFDIRDDMTGINDSWLKAMQAMHRSSANDEEGAGSVEELEKKLYDLKIENNRMSEELADAMQTMESIVKEYSLMYAGKENETMDRLSSDYNQLKKKADSHKKPEKD